MSDSSMQKTLRSLWSPKREEAWVEEICPLPALGCYMNEKVPSVKTLKLCIYLFWQLAVHEIIYLHPQQVTFPSFTSQNA